LVRTIRPLAFPKQVIKASNRMRVCIEAIEHASPKIQN